MLKFSGALLAACLWASPAFAACHQIANSTGFDAHTHFRYCDDQPSYVELNMKAVLAHPGMSARDIRDDIEIRFQAGSINFAATPAKSWGRDRVTNGGFIAELADRDAASGLARAINAGETVTISIVRQSTSEVHEVFSEVFAMRFPESLLTPIPAAGEIASPSAADAASDVGESLTPLQAEVDSHLARSRPYQDWLDRRCILDSAASVRDQMKAARLVSIGSDIARLDAVLADPNLSPRARPMQERRREDLVDEQNRLQRLEASSLSAQMVFSEMLNTGQCRDAASTRASQLADCQKFGRENCTCEADAFAQSWVDNRYKVSSRGLTQMNVAARAACRG